MYQTGRKPEEIIEEKGYKAQDDGELEQLVKDVLAENPQAVEDIKE
jgi:Asp-tRNA(Asn)/Glu-tRNA(Gln) amidotransferase B subunit